MLLIMRKIHTLIGASVLSALVLTGCSQAEETASKASDTMMKASESASASMDKMDKDKMEKSDAMSPSESAGAMEHKDHMEQDGEHGDAMHNDGMKKDDAMMKAGSYITYDEYMKSMDSMAKEEGPVVLFFNASWCPDCQAMDKELKGNPGAIPAGVTLVSVDYDSHNDLRQKYGVTMQHTFVQVDKDGNAINTWNATSVDDIAQQVKQ